MSTVDSFAMVRHELLVASVNDGVLMDKGIKGVDVSHYLLG